MPNTCNLTNADCIMNREEQTGHLIIDSSFDFTLTKDELKKITSVHLEKNAKKLKPGYFANCPNVTRFTVAANNPYYEDIDGNLYTKKKDKRLIRYAAGKGDETFELPEGVVEIDVGAFDHTVNLKKIIFPRSLMKIKPDEHGAILKNCTSIEEFVIHPYNPIYSVYNCDLYNKSGSKLLKYATGKGDTVFSLPDFCQNIRPYAFCGAKEVTHVILPKAVSIISEGAFFGCAKLTKVEFKKPHMLREICSYAFANTNIIHFAVPQGTYKLHTGIFQNTNLLSIYIPESVQECSAWMIGSSEDKCCVYLESRTPPASWHTNWGKDKASGKTFTRTGFVPLWWYEKYAYI